MVERPSGERLVMTPIIWPGGKTLLLPELRKLTPPHRVAIDLFCGGGAWILDDCHWKGVMNDKDGDVVNFFRVMRDEETSMRLHKLLLSTPYARDEYFACVGGMFEAVDPVERARRWFVAVNQGFTHEVGNASFRVSGATQIGQAFRNHVDDLPAVHDKLRNIEVENLDWRYCLRMYERSDDPLVFADPPYINGNADGLVYANTMSVSDHYDLIVALTNSPAQVMLCGYESEMYYDMLRPPTWQLHIHERRAQVGNSGQEKGWRREHIWMKFRERGLWS